MDRRARSAKLVGWIKLLPDSDGYGVALFRGTGNTPLTPETNADLRITRFDEFYNEAGYAVSHILPPGYAERRYKIGDRLPIPVMLDGIVEVVDAATSAERFSADHGAAAASPIVRRVAEILAAVQAGDYRKASAERAVRRLRMEHDDILSGEPAHSAYWIQRLGLVGGAIRRMPKEDQATGREVMGSRAAAWLQRFGYKSEPSLLIRLMRVAAEGGGTRIPAARAAVFIAMLAKFHEAGRPSKSLSKIILLFGRVFGPSCGLTPSVGKLVRFGLAAPNLLPGGGID